jgi:hypothetical protein
MEFQRRGVVHFHVVFEEDFLRDRGWLAECYVETIKRKGKETRILRGPFEAIIVRRWIMAVEDTDLAFLRFQRGGIVELFRTANGAACYFGSYLAKADQKTLPFGLDGCGRWWAISRNATPKWERSGRLTKWNTEQQWAHVFDKSKLSGCVDWKLPHGAKLVTEMDFDSTVNKQTK